MAVEEAVVSSQHSMLSANSKEQDSATGRPHLTVDHRSTAGYSNHLNVFQYASKDIKKNITFIWEFADSIHFLYMGDA